MIPSIGALKMPLDAELLGDTRGHRHRKTTWNYSHFMRMDGLRDSEPSIDWDSAENMHKGRVSLLLKGCSCKSGCETR